MHTVCLSARCLEGDMLDRLACLLPPKMLFRLIFWLVKKTLMIVTWPLRNIFALTCQLLGVPWTKEEKTPAALSNLPAASELTTLAIPSSSLQPLMYRRTAQGRYCVAAAERFRLEGQGKWQFAVPDDNEVCFYTHYGELR